ncbi:MAG: adenylosuccinate lyase [Candidatus Lambdaproteobacteria bacterium RIFOXYD1_FULL_56_27]|uniref:Adenylosuccinate lyase n=1 Tax=Candidatus Lambdaproteobacteria bacterium RIFOXYD2_FULL_56_26 TaxID=1817773 RepID=A0A1F6GLU8_9PROT|nr:MAG: adenylosuccinate lyase [Candidatus Lambdaproteobacteria bacterium RIFOXYD2_FULL_56_26]OGH01457.1 MAG: adenylosuccinate lyase [Candidatus Lambdaproteobacteria bacterium RIFOXYC1_FULL_56_13]OGH07055.1 MAG: adenylosuccinate lyase [Candidatus Lambdaproteobacteria bacterium RIFOXYD1_FULL_56_27]
MTFDSLTALCPLDGRYESKLAPLRPIFSEFGLIRFRLQVEVEWLISLGAHTDFTALSPLPNELCAKLRGLYHHLTPQQASRVKELEKTTNHDVKAVEYWIGEQLTQLGQEGLKPFVHFACTSEDINNLAYGLMVKAGVKEELLPQLIQVTGKIEEMAQAYRKVPMMARTHGQPASPTTMGKEFYNVYARLSRQLKGLEAQEYLGKINGAVGNFNAHQVACPQMDWRGFAAQFVSHLGLTYNPYTTQIEPHDYLAELFGGVIRSQVILLDFCRDLWGYISNEAFTQIPVAGEVGSSTMPHKINPIDFENAEGNLGLSNALLDHLAQKLPISRWQRDLTDSTVLRNMGVALGYGLLAYQSILKGLSKLKVNPLVLEQELSSSWLLLGEALQTVMRLHQIPDAYERLKALTRGKTVGQEELEAFVEALDLPLEVKQQLKALRPETYLGYAEDF